MSRISFSFLLSFLLITGLSAQIKLPRLISDGLILQRNEPLKIWGWAAPNEALSMKFDDQTYQAKANSTGRWAIMLPPQQAGGPHSLEFKASNELTVQDVYFGDVWLCSGQSNMELTMERVKEKYSDIVQEANNSLIRQFLVPDSYDFNVLHEDLENGEWVSVSPETILSFAAVGYFFARELFQEKGVPIGLINAALGGSPVESWMSEEALKKYPESYAELQKFKDPKLIEKIQSDDRNRMNKWYRDVNAKDKGLQKNSPEWAQPDLDDTSWEEYTIPGFWADQSIGFLNGVVWFRKKIMVPESMTGKTVRLWMGRIVDQDYVYVNGEMVGTTGYQYPPRRYTVKPGILKPGENTIAVRVINNAGRGGFVFDKPYYLAVGSDSIDLKGAWKAKVGAEMPRLQGETFIRWKAGGLYNKMIHPLLDFKIKGALWYQGESNAGRPNDYADKLSDMIIDWRQKWGQGDFPFLIVQLANFLETTSEPVESNWAELRQQQLETLEVPNTGLAVIIDVGEWNDIHPLDKQTVGQRLASLARKLAYEEKKVPGLSPLPKKTSFKQNQVVIKFENAKKGLMTKGGGDIMHLAISEDGKNFVWAESQIKKNKIIVWHDSISNPTVVRYAWSDNPESANLVSKDVTPVTPFEVKK